VAVIQFHVLILSFSFSVQPLNFFTLHKFAMIICMRARRISAAVCNVVARRNDNFPVAKLDVLVPPKLKS
jgi:hypothetical protein